MNPVAARTEDAYAFETGIYSRREWGRIADWLQREEGYSDEQVEVILRSKFMRWAGDHVGKSRSVTLANFQDFYTTTYASGSSTVESIRDMLAEEGVPVTRPLCDVHGCVNEAAIEVPDLTGHWLPAICEEHYRRWRPLPGQEVGRRIR